MSIYQLEHDGDAAGLRSLLDTSESAAVRARAAEALGAVTEGDDEDVETLVRIATADDDGRVRATAIEALSDVGIDALVALFVELGGLDRERIADEITRVVVDSLDGDRPELRLSAAHLAGLAEIRDALPALLGRLDDPVPRVRAGVVRAVGRLRDPSAVDALVPLATDPSNALRREVATALGEVGGPAALDALRPLLDDRDRTVRSAAVSALGEHGSPQAVRMLVDRLADPSERVRREAAFTLIDALSSGTGSDSHERRSAVVETMSMAPDEAVVTALVDLFESSTEPRRRRNAVWLLGRVSDREPRVVDTLVAALDDGDETVRQFAATSLLAVDREVAETALLSALETTYGDGRGMIVYLLGKVGGERARAALLALLDESGTIDTQERVLAALSRLGGGSTVGEDG